MTNIIFHICIINCCRRGTSRVAGLKSLEELMTNHFCNEFVADRYSLVLKMFDMKTINAYMQQLMLRILRCRDIVSTLLRCGRTDSDSVSSYFWAAAYPHATGVGCCSEMPRCALCDDG